MNTAARFLVLASLVLAVNPGRADSALYSDHIFNPDDWNLELEVRPPVDDNFNGFGDGKVEQAEPGRDGGTDTYWRVYVKRDPDVAAPDVSTTMWSFSRVATLDLFELGGIDGVSLSLYGQQFGGGSGGLLAPAVRQNRIRYRAPGLAVPENEWALKSFDALTATSFGEVGVPSDHPDFSFAGGSIEIGFAYVVSTSTEQTVERTVGFDDWQLSVDYAAPPDVNPGMSDAWFDPATNGQGFFIIVFPEKRLLFLSWFTYDTERPPQDVVAHLGEPGHRWLTAQGPYEGNAAALDVYLTAGGVFDSAEPPADPADLIGTIDMVWHSCKNATLTYDLPGLALSGTVRLQRIVSDHVALCESFD